MAGYTVIDFETTGLNPRHDRVVEVGVVKVSHDGEVYDAWGTLVNRTRGAMSVPPASTASRLAMWPGHPRSPTSHRVCWAAWTGASSLRTTPVSTPASCPRSCTAPATRSRR